LKRFKFGLAPKEIETIMHEPAAPLFGEAFSDRFADCIKGCVGHSEHVKFVHYDEGRGEKCAHGLLIGQPHIHRDAPDSIPIWETTKEVRYGGLIPIGQNVDNGIVLDVGYDTPGLSYEMDFVYPHPHRGLENIHLFEELFVFPEDGTDGPLCASNLTGDAGERPLERLLRNPVVKPGGHAFPLGNIGQRLGKGLSAPSTSKTAGRDINGNPLCLYQEIPNQNLLSPSAHQVVVPAMDALSRRINRFDGNVEVVSLFFGGEDAITDKSKYVCHLNNSYIFPFGKGLLHG
jgi:hypothetical protein